MLLIANPYAALQTQRLVLYSTTCSFFPGQISPLWRGLCTVRRAPMASRKDIAKSVSKHSFCPMRRFVLFLSFKILFYLLHGQSCMTSHWSSNFKPAPVTRSQSRCPHFLRYVSRPASVIISRASAKPAAG